MDLAKKKQQQKNPPRHIVEGSQALSSTGLLILRLQIEKGVKWHVVESGHCTMRQFTDNHLLHKD